MGSVALIIIGKNDIEESSLIQCYGQTECTTSFKAKEEMLPISYIYAYNLKQDGNVQKSTIKIDFNEFSANFIKVSINSAKLEPGKDAIIEINSKSNSIIGLLAFDKSLSFLRKGNDIDKKDVLTVVENSDDPMHVLKIDLNFRICTSEEKVMIEKAREIAIDERFGDDEFNEFDDFETDENDIDEPERAGKVRRNFQESWIFDTVELGHNDKLEKKYKLPDAITTWLVSGFSINTDHGFALSDPQELIATQEFFVKMSLPYSIKFGEILKIDLVVFNYVKSGNDLKVKLKLFDDDFSIVELKNAETCEIIDVSSNQDNAGEISFELALNSGITKSFYIKPTEQKRKINLKVKALATETQNRRKRYSDAIEKTLNVIHEGATHYKGEMKTFDFSTQTTNTTSGKLEFENAVEGSILIHGSITGNIIGPSLSIFEEYL
jgi:hypothetical protein